MIKLMPTVMTLTNKNEIQQSTKGTAYMKICVASEDQYIWSAVFGGTANYINDYANIGAQIFIEEWHLTKKDKYYDFIITKCRIVKNKEEF